MSKHCKYGFLIAAPIKAQKTWILRVYGELVCMQGNSCSLVHISVPTNNSFLTATLCLYVETSLTIPKQNVWRKIKFKHCKTQSVGDRCFHLIHTTTDLSYHEFWFSIANMQPFNLKSIKTLRKAVR